MKLKSISICKRAILSAGFAALFFSACKKNNDSSPSGISATINGKSWQSSAGADAGSYASGMITVYGARTTDMSQLAIYWTNDITVGKATDFDGDHVVQYSVGTTIYTSYPDFGSHGSVTVNSWDSTGKKLVGVFSGVLYNFDSSGDSVVVTNGKFNVSYKMAD